MRSGWILGFLGVLVLAVGAGSAVRVRHPVANGLYYPAEPRKLLAAVNQYMDEAKTPELPGRYMGCIAPHSAYPFCGAAMGHAFRPLKPGQYDRVIVLASSHFAEFEGCSIPAVQYYRTPLGDVELDGPAIGRLQWCPLIDTRSVTSKGVKYYSDGTSRYPLHEVEYSIEVILPFLQARLGHFRLVPLIVGNFEGREGEINEMSLRAAAEALREIIDDRTFVVASSDLTHFGSAYGYQPFSEDIPNQIEGLDTQCIDILMHRDYTGFREFLSNTEDRICGVYVLELFLQLMSRDTQGVLLDYRTSSQVTGDPQTSVSYAAIAFFDRTLAPPEEKTYRAPKHVGPPPDAAAQAPPPPLMPSQSIPPAPPAKVEKEPRKKGLIPWFGKDEK
ncbi:MAG: AmmeMemoRadiSam system protein B [FCB group bacterium]|nr:AmmeMemoRadiSam system protein B [FCB group bacterium]